MNKNVQRKNKSVDGFASLLQEDAPSRLIRRMRPEASLGGCTRALHRAEEPRRSALDTDVASETQSLK